jgi:hypothetical protein
MLRVLVSIVIIWLVWVGVIYVNYRMALAGAPQQQWFYCHVLEWCKEPVR